MPRLAEYKYTGLTGALRDILREAPTRARPDKVNKEWLRSAYGVSSNGDTILSVLLFIGLIGKYDNNPTGLWDAISHPTPENKARFADAVRKAYGDLFKHYPDAHRQNDEVLRTFFERQMESDHEAQRKHEKLRKTVNTFKTLLPFGDFDAALRSSSNKRVDLPELVQGVEALNNAAEIWLNVHSEVQLRLEAFSPLRKRLDDLALEQPELLRDSLSAAEARLFRASHVLAWGGLVDFLYKPFDIDAVNDKYSKWRLESMEDLYVKQDLQLIVLGKELGYYRETMRRTLEGLLNGRNRCAHGSGYDPVLEDTLGFVNQILNVITDLKATPGSLWARVTSSVPPL
jgi:hypothetical protein